MLGGRGETSAQALACAGRRGADVPAPACRLESSHTPGQI